MGFLQKFFSIGSRRSKKKHASAERYDVPPLPNLRRQQEDHEATVNRLLRSSSATFAAIEETEDATLAMPPFVHRISGTSTHSTTSLASVGQRGTYTVKVHPRTILARTEFPNANPEVPLTPRLPQHDSLRRRSKSVPITPRDKTRLLGLRADPSVASLLNIYDEHGCLDSKVFSNSPSPEKQGRVQTHRTGSTLRELLGGPSSMSSRKTHDRNSSAVEGDISWAERYLCESAESSTSSLLRTPNDAGFPDNHFTHNYKNDMLSESHDFTTNQSDLYPAISSLEVELSMVTEAPATPTKRSNNPYANDNYATPQRASQVFEFLTTKKSRARARSQPEERGVERQLPALPVPAQPSSSRFSFSSAESHEHHIPLSTHIHSDENESKSHEDAPNWPSASNWIEQASTRAGCQDHSEDPEDNSMLQQDGLKLHEVVVNSGTEAQASRIPRGPRPLPQSAYHAAKPTRSEQFHLPFCDIHLDSGARRNIEDTLRSNYATISAPDLSLSNDTDAFTPAPSRPPHHRTASRFSTALAHDPVAQPSTIPEAPYIRKPVRRKQPPSKWGHMMHDKENDRKGLLPITPVRSHSVFRAPRSTTPSPASSTDLSPVARQLMADLRTQRMRARERDRKNGKRSTTSKLKA